MSNSVSPPRGLVKRAKPGAIAFQLILVAALLMVIWFSWRANVSPRSGVPHRLGNLELIPSSVVSGPQALAQLEELHQTDIELVDGYIAHYAKGSETVQVWAGIAENETAASKLVQRMTEAINKGNSPFSIPQQIAVDGKEIFNGIGRDGNYYYYSSASKTIWLTINSADPISLVRQALRTF